MHTRNIQTFLMVSAAFFAMNAPVRSRSAETLATAVTRSMQIGAASHCDERVAKDTLTVRDENDA